MKVKSRHFLLPVDIIDIIIRRVTYLEDSATRAFEFPQPSLFYCRNQLKYKKVINAVTAFVYSTRLLCGSYPILVLISQFQLIQGGQ